jgi:hypothetical protein
LFSLPQIHFAQFDNSRNSCSRSVLVYVSGLKEYKNFPYQSEANTTNQLNNVSVNCNTKAAHKQKEMAANKAPNFLGDIDNLI